MERKESVWTGRLKNTESFFVYLVILWKHREFRVVAKKGRVMLNANGKYAMLVTISFVYI